VKKMLQLNLMDILYQILSLRQNISPQHILCTINFSMISLHEFSPKMNTYNLSNNAHKHITYVFCVHNDL